MWIVACCDGCVAKGWIVDENSLFTEMLIVFSGTDGAGKSTQIGVLAEALRGKEEQVRCVWTRGGYTPGFAALKSLVRRLRPSALPKPGESQERTKRLGSPHVRRIWLLLSVLDLFWQLVVVLRARLVLGRTVLCDRYLEDTLLDFRRNFPQEDVGAWGLWRLLRCCAPKPNFRFLLLVPPAESTRRSLLKNEPFPDSPETLAWRYEAYLALAASGDWEVIDCQQSIEDVQRAIAGKILT